MIEKHRLHHLHAIRGWAALLVVIAHAKNHFWVGGSEYMSKYPIHTWDWYQYLLMVNDIITSFAEIYVITFFVLSGFFIARSIRMKQYSIPFFYGDRIIRIYIPYIGALFITYITFYSAYVIYPELFHLYTINHSYNKILITAFNDFNIKSFALALFFLPGKSGIYYGANYPIWSLYFEALFYIMIPFILLFMRKYWFFIIAFFLFIASFFYESSWLTIRTFIFSYTIYFAMGVLLFQLVDDIKTRYIIIFKIRAYTDMFFLLSMILMFAAIILGYFGYRKHGFFLGMIATALIILLVLYGRNTNLFFYFKKLLINKVSEFLGKISFSLYLVHLPFLTIFYTLWAKYTGELISYDRIYWFAVFAVIPFGYLSYYIFERSSLILLQKYKDRYAIFQGSKTK